MSFDYTTLITDRTQADVARVKALAAKGWAAMTDDERGEWLYGALTPWLDADGEQLIDVNGEPLYCRDGVQRGAYNASDLNRVSACVADLVRRLNGAGYAVPGYSRVKIERASSRLPDLDPYTWYETDAPTESEAAQYLANVAAVRRVLAVLSSTPAAPESMEGLTVGMANDIEQILADVDALITHLRSAWHYSGELYAGEV